MKISTRGKIELACHEGLSTQIYFDSVRSAEFPHGVRTIGIGATVTEIPSLNEWPLTDSLSIPDVFDLFDKSLEKYENAIDSVLTAKVTQPQYDALVGLAYNIGCGGVKRSTLIRNINAGMGRNEIYTAFMMWNHPPEIIGRRKQEALLYTTGEYQCGGKTELYDTEGTGHTKHIKIININDYIK